MSFEIIFQYQTFVAVSGISGGEKPGIWRCLVVLRTRNLSFYLTQWKLHRVWTSNGSELLCCFKTVFHRYETEIGQKSWLRNLPKQESEEHNDESEQAAAGEEMKEDTPLSLIFRADNILHTSFSKVNINTQEN